MNAAEVLIKRIEEGIRSKQTFLIAVDGRCASGKTTLANSIMRETGAAVVHMDDFFLQPFQRTEKRLNTPGGNVDWERFKSEVLLPLSRGENARFCPFDCHSLSFKDAISVNGNKGVVVEGSYSCHPELWDLYDLHIFLDVDKKTQLQRIEARNGAEGLSLFKKKWIPLEEEYFSAFHIKGRCDYCFRCE